MSNSFRSQAFAGFSWIVTLRFAAKTLSYIKVIILARILSPNDFGQFGLVLSILSLAETFSETGVGESLIQRSSAQKTHFSSAWLILGLRGLIISSILFLLAPHLASFFNTDAVLIQAISVIPLIKIAINPGIFIWRRQLKFHKEVLIQISSALAELVVAVIALVYTQSAWALYYGLLAGVLTQVAISLTAPINFVKPTQTAIVQLFHFGKWINLNSILSYLTHEGDDLVVGKLLNTHALGLYQTAYRFSLLPTTQISGPVATIGYPLVTNAQTASQKLERTIKLAWLISYPVLAISCLIFLYPQAIIQVFFTKEWLEMADLLRVLVLYGILRSLGGVLGWYYPSVNRPQVNTNINAIKFLVMAGLIIPMIKTFGVMGAAYSILIASIIANILQLWSFRTETGSSALRFLWPSYLSAFITTTIVWVGSIFSGSYLVQLIRGSCIFILVFVVVSLVLDSLLRDVCIQEGLPRLPKNIRTRLITWQLLIKRRGWHDFNWRQNVQTATNKDWQTRYDQQWQHDRHDSLLVDDIVWVQNICKVSGINTVLEIGPGKGTLAKHLSAQQIQVTTIDISQVVLNNLESDVMGRIQARGEVLPFADRSFDAVIATHVLEHVDDLAKTVTQWKRVSKKALIIIVPKEGIPEVGANYHLQFFDTPEKLVDAIGLKDYQVSSHKNPNDHKLYLRFIGKVDF